jgi:hypothetical protein
MKTKFALYAMLVSITSVIAVGQQVSVNYNHSQSFSQFHTYAWGSDNANQVQDSILAQVAIQDIDSALQCVGYARDWRRHGRHNSRTKCYRDLDRRSV